MQQVAAVEYVVQSVLTGKVQKCCACLIPADWTPVLLIAQPSDMLKGS